MIVSTELKRRKWLWVAAGFVVAVIIWASGITSWPDFLRAFGVLCLHRGQDTESLALLEGEAPRRFGLALEPDVKVVVPAGRLEGPECGYRRGVRELGRLFHEVGL